MKTLQELGWTEIIHNDEDFIYEFQKYEKYIDIDEEYVDIYIYNYETETRYGTWLGKDEIAAINEIMKKYNKEDRR